MPDNMLIDIEQMKNYSDDQLVLITTGSQGETMAALLVWLLPFIKRFLLSGRCGKLLKFNTIQAMRRQYPKVINELSMKGAKVIYQDTHVSGHACQEEIKLIYTLTKPKYAVPVHGEYKHLIRLQNWLSHLHSKG